MSYVQEHLITIWKDRETRTMSDTSTLALIVATVGIALTCLLFSLLRQREKRYCWQRTSNSVQWTGMCLLLLMLAACGDGSTSSPSVPPTITPLAVTATAQHGATPTVTSLSSTDWPTYHRD